jgi:hypothetical protein
MRRDGCNGNDSEECNCCIEIEDSLVLIICGEVDVDRLNDSLRAFINVKDSNVVEDASAD